VAKKIGLALLVLSTLALSGCDLILDLIFGGEMTVELTASSYDVYSLQEVMLKAEVENASGTVEYTWYIDGYPYTNSYSTRYFARYVGDTTLFYTIKVSADDGENIDMSDEITIWVYPYLETDSGSLEFRNDSTETVSGLWVQESNSYTWGTDVLDANLIPSVPLATPGPSFTLIDLPPSMYYISFDAGEYNYEDTLTQNDLSTGGHAYVVYPIDDAALANWGSEPAKGLLSRSIAPVGTRRR
jgi:hypothetical protein